MLAGPLTTSPEPTLHLTDGGAAATGTGFGGSSGNSLYTANNNHSGNGADQEEEEEDDDEEREMDVSRLQFNFAADIDADIALDNSVRTDPRMNSYSYSINASSAAANADLAESQRLKRGGTLPGGGIGAGAGAGGQSSGNGGPGGVDHPWSAAAAANAAAGSKPATMTLKEQEKVIDQLKKESFSLKLKIFFLEERLAKVSPEHVDQALHENVEMKVKLQTMHSELKQYKRLLLEAHAAIEALQAQQKICDLEHGMSEAEQKEYQRALQESKELKNVLKELNEQLQEMEQEAKSNENEIATLQSQAKDFELLQRQYEDRIQKLNEELDEAGKQGFEEAQIWKDRYMKLQQEADDAYTAKAHMEKALAETEHQLQILKDNHDQELTLQSQDHRDELSRHNLMVADLKSQLENERAARMQEREMHRNDMEALSEEWTRERQHMHAQNDTLLAELDEQRKENDELARQVQELLLWKEEDAVRHDQEMGDVVAELDDKIAEIERLSAELDHYQGLKEELDIKDDRIFQLEQQIEAMEIARKEANDVHDEVVARLKSKIQANVHQQGVNPAQVSEEVHIWRERFEQSKKEADELSMHLHEIENQLIMERNKAVGGQHWREEKIQMEMRHAEVVGNLQDQIIDLNDRIAELNKALNDRDDSILRYKEKLAIATQEIKEAEQRYKDMEIRSSNHAETINTDLTALRNELEQIKSSRAEASEQAASEFASEKQRLEYKLRRLQDTASQLENEKKQHEISLEDRNKTIAKLKSRVIQLEWQLNNKRDEGTSESTSSAMAERNSLLLRVLEHIENIMGRDSRLDPNMLPKPSANFKYFSKHLCSRLEGLSNVYDFFEKRSKELDDRVSNEHLHIRKDLEINIKRLEKWEGITRAAADRQRLWREKLVKKTGEIEALQAKVTQLTKLLNEAKTRTVSNEKIHDLEVRCKHAEHKLQKYANSEELWNARIRELERRTKEAEEGRVRDRQGANERLASQKDENRALQKSNEALQARNRRLQHEVDIYKTRIQMAGGDTEDPTGKTGGGGSGGGRSGSYHSSLPSASMSQRINTEIKLMDRIEDLRKELEQQERVTEKEHERVRTTLRELEAANAQLFMLQQRLSRHDSLFKDALGRIESLSKRREVLESPSLRQATNELYRLLGTEDGWNG
ncbi:hypothetical protein BGW41_004664 [Actinomortierella wolfii]|nr:hypothetical protein BGW41_004664 [Actinomortierella wolfii]